VNDVASLTENGTSKTLASVFTNNVFPISNARDTQLILLRENLIRTRSCGTTKNKAESAKSEAANARNFSYIHHQNITFFELWDSPPRAEEYFGWLPHRSNTCRANTTFCYEESDLASNYFIGHTVNRCVTFCSSSQLVLFKNG